MLVVPVGGGSSDDEAVGFDEEDQGPDEVDNVEGEEGFHGSSDLKVLEGVLVLGSDGFPQGVEAGGLQEPQHEESDRNKEQNDRQHHNQTVLGDEPSSHLYDTRRQRNPLPVAHDQHDQQNGQDEADHSCDDASS